MLQSSFSMIDQIMVGQLGKVSVAAVEIGSKPGFVFAFVSGAVAVVIRCKNHSEYPLYVSFASALVNTALNYLLIFGHFAFPSLGIQGAAIASLASQFVNLLFMILFFARLSSFSFKIILTRGDLWQYLAMLLPIVFNEFLWTLGQNINTGIYGHLGTDELAAMSLTGPVQGLLMGAWLIGLPLGLLSAFVFKLSLVWVYFILSQEELFRLLVTIFIFKKKKWMNSLS